MLTKTNVGTLYNAPDPIVILASLKSGVPFDADYVIKQAKKA